MSQGLERLLGSTLTGKSGAVPTSSIDASVIGIYFSAHWCPPCRQFTPMLARRYNELKAQNKAFEVVFVSSDHDQNSFSEYYASMPWLCVPFEDRSKKATLSQAFGVSGIPTLILVDRTGKILDRNGRQKVFDPVFANQLPSKVDPEVRGLSLESVIDLISTDLSLNSESTKAGYTTLVKIINKALRSRPLRVVVCHLYLDSILQNPGDPKYLSLRKGNATVQSKLGNRNFIKILKIAGFTETPDAYKCSDDPDTAKLKEVRDVLSSLLLSMA